MKLQESNNTQVGGHRGLPLVYPDNTLEGITAAAEVADFIELDVRRSSDGLMVLSHDPALRDTTIHDHAWAELRNIDLGGGYHPALLEFILDALPNTPLDIEIKNSPLQPGFDPGGVFAVEVAACARPFDVVTCFFWPTMDIVKRTLPHVRTGLLVDEGGSLTDAFEAAVAAGHEVVAPHYSLLVNSSSRPIDQAHDAGLEVVTWTVNDVAVAARLVGDGVDGIISDDPERIQQEKP